MLEIMITQSDNGRGVEYPQGWYRLADGIWPHYEVDIVHINEHLYVFGGLNSKYEDKLFRYSLKNDTWEEVIAANNPPPARYRHSCVGHNGLFYVLGGYHNSIKKSRNDVWAYNPKTNLWSQKVNIPKTISSTALTSYGDFIYLVAGSNTIVTVSLQYTKEKTVYRYNTKTNSWSNLANYPIGTYDLRVVSNENSIISSGGVGINNYYNYNKENNSWSVIWEEYDIPRINHSMNLLGDELFIYGGYSSLLTLENTFIKRSLVDGGWENIPLENDHPGDRRLHGSCNYNNSFFVYGGYNKTTLSYDSALWVYTP